MLPSPLAAGLLLAVGFLAGGLSLGASSGRELVRLVVVSALTTAVLLLITWLVGIGTRRSRASAVDAVLVLASSLVGLVAVAVVVGVGEILADLSVDVATLAPASAVGAVLALAMVARPRRVGVGLVALAVALALQVVVTTLASSPLGVVLVAVATTLALLGVALVGQSTAPVTSLRTLLVRHRSVVVVAGATAAALAVRMLVDRGLWLDEATSAFQAQLPFREMLLNLRDNADNHPPLHHTVLWLTVRAIGTSEFALRLPSMIFGTMLVPMLYVAGRELYGRRAGAMGAVLGAVAPVAVWYAQEARMYSLFMLLATVAVWAQARAVRSGKTRYWAAYVLGSAALVWTQYFGVLQVVAQQLVFLVVVVERRRDHPRRNAVLTRGVPAMVFIALLVAPLVPFAATQFQNNQESGLGFSTTAETTLRDGAGDLVDEAEPEGTVAARPSIYGVLTNVAWGSFGYHSDGVMQRIIAVWPLGILAGLVLLGRRRLRANRLLLAVAGVPMVVVFAASLVASGNRSLFEIRYFVGAVPAGLLLLAGALSAWSATRRGRLVAAGVVVALFGTALVHQSVGPDNPRVYGYRETLSAIAEDAGPGDVLVYEPNYLDYVLDYYDPGIPSSALADGLPEVERGDRIYILASFGFAGTRGSQQRVDDALATLGTERRLVNSYERAQVKVWVFA